MPAPATSPSPAPPETEAWRTFLHTGDEAAFADLVRHHLNLVYGTAFRCCGRDSALAQDATQTVFCDLVRKARTLPDGVILAGWLYRHATFVSSNLVRSEHRRRRREEAAATNMGNPDADADDVASWDDVGPVLDEALADLPERDRLAIVLRYLDGQRFARIAEQLGTSEDAARMRTDRALDKLRDWLARRGVTSTSAALGLVLTQQAGATAPDGLAMHVAGAALAGATVAGGTAASAAGILGFMSTSKIITGASCALAVALASVAYKSDLDRRRLRAELASALAAKAASPQTEPAGIDDAARKEAQREKEQLLALRSEVGRLREELNQARAAGEENAELKSAVREMQKRIEGGKDEAETEEDTLMLARMKNTKNWAWAFVAYASENGGKLPTSFSAAESFFPKEDRALMAAFDPNRFEILFQGAFEDVREPNRTLLIRERDAVELPARGKRPARTVRTYVFLDGHSEIHAAPDGNFEAWERERMPPEANRVAPSRPAGN